MFKKIMRRVGTMNKNVVIVSNNLELSKSIKKILIDKFRSIGYTTSEEIKKNTELIISIGGDGSFLKAARDFNFPEIPFFCVNTGHLGFFAEILPTEDEIDYFLDSYLNGNFNRNSMDLLEIDIHSDSGQKERRYAINELVVRGYKSRTAHLNLFVDKNYMETFSGDGLIISTSTGSTAYNYSSGGSIVDNRLKIIQITPISPISTNAFRSFTSSIILPGFDSEISINPEYKNDIKIITVFDGEEFEMSGITKINTRLSDKKITLLRLTDYEFWDRVYQKFLKTYDYKQVEFKSLK